MGMTGSIGYYVGDLYYSCNWELTSQSKSGNYSVIKSTHKLQNPMSTQYTIGNNVTAVCKTAIGSNTSQITDHLFGIAAYSTLTIGTTTNTVYHNSDGSCTATLQDTFTLGSRTYVKSATIVLPKITRINTVSVGNATVGTALSITINRYNSYKTTIEYTVGNATGTIVTATTATSASYTFPYDICNQFGASEKTIPLKLKVTSVNASGASSGNYTKTVNITIPDNENTKPTVTVTATEANEDNTLGVFVQNHSAILGQITAVPKYGAAASVYSATLDGSTFAGAQFTTATIGNSGTFTLTASVTDSRGFVGTASIDIVVYPWTAVSMSAITAKRAEDGTATDDGEDCLLSLNYSISSLGSFNSRYCKISAQPVGEDAWHTISESQLQSYSGTLQNNIQTFTFSSNTTYTLKVEIWDAFSKAEKLCNIPTAKVIMDFNESGYGMGLGKVSEADELEIDFASMFTKEAFGLTGFLLAHNDGAIPEYGDFNSYKKTGIYKCHYSNCSNAPTAEAGVLIVKTGEGDAEKDFSLPWHYYQQIFIPRIPTAVYMRSMIVWGTAGEWSYSHWYKFEGTML